MYKLFLVSKDSLKAQVSQMSFRNLHLCYDPNPYMFIVAAVNTSLSPSYSFSTGSQQFQINNNGLLNNNNGLFAKASPGCTPL